MMDQVDGLTIGGLALLFQLVLIALGFPIAIAVGISGFVGAIMLIGFPKALSLLMTTPYYSSAQFAFTVLPLFVFMGELAFFGEMAGDLFKAVSKWLGRLHGGLAQAVSAGCAFFAVVTGSSIATVATFTRLAVPELKRYNYDDKLTYGVIASSGSLAVLIPPSGAMVLYCMLTDVSLGGLMLAGFIPGVVSAILYMLMIYVRARLNPKLGPPSTEVVTWKERLSSLRWLGPIIFVMVVMLGGLYLGVFTPTEAGAFGVLAVLVMVLSKRGLSLKRFKESVKSTVLITAMIYFIIIMSMIYAKFIGLTGISHSLEELLTRMAIPPIVVVIILMVIYLFLGTFLDVVAMMCITLPIFFPIIAGLGLNGIWFGILVIKQCEMAVITPPVGMNVFTIKAIMGEAVSLKTIYDGTYPFLVMDIVILAILMAFPQISLFLPGLMTAH